MVVKRGGNFVIICLLLLSLGCAAGISNQARSQVTYEGSFSELQKASDDYIGETCLFGGKILENRASTTFSELTVLHLVTDSRDRPKDDEQSQGRYLVQSNQFLDPAIYKKGALLTVVGRLIGKEVRSIGEYKYVYPKLEAIELKVWPETDYYPFPRFHFGIGVGIID